MPRELRCVFDTGIRGTVILTADEILNALGAFE